MSEPGEEAETDASRTRLSLVANVLEIGEVDADRSFPAQGGDSLDAMVLSLRIRERR